MCRSHGVGSMGKSEEARAEYAASALQRLQQDVYILEHRMEIPPMSFGEIAKALDMPKTTVYQRYEGLLTEGYRRLKGEPASSAE